MKYPPSELVLNDKGNVYHLNLSPTQLANNILLVGDQDRVSLISSCFDEIEHQVQHREFICHTGFFKGKRISAISTGIGTDNIDIVVNELDSLVNIDLEKRTDKTTKTQLNLIRIGTCGILQADIPIHAYILSNYAYGLDNIAHFYEIPFNETERLLNQKLQKQLNWKTTIQPYVIQSDEALTNKLESDLTFKGITVTSSGFYGPQGRKLRVNLSHENINEKLTEFRENDLQVLNFEMESSALFALAKALNHKATTICLGIANRPCNTFSRDYSKEMKDLILYVLNKL